MLERRHRLTTSAGFTTATRRGSRAGTRTMVLHLVVASGAEPQVGFVVGKAIGNAVIRNAVRRRLRHLARTRVALLPGSGVLVVRALPAAAGATYDAMGQDFDRALQRLGVAVEPGATVKTGVGA